MTAMRSSLEVDALTELILSDLTIQHPKWPHSSSRRAYIDVKNLSNSLSRNKSHDWTGIITLTSPWFKPISLWTWLNKPLSPSPTVCVPEAKQQPFPISQWNCGWGPDRCTVTCAGSEKWRCEDDHFNVHREVIENWRYALHVYVATMLKSSQHIYHGGKQRKRSPRIDCYIYIIHQLYI